LSKSLVRAVALLDCFLEKPEMTINELTEMANMPKTTVFRLASSLVESGLLVKHRKTSHDVTYKMSLKMVTYGKHVSEQLQLNKISLPYMKKLNEKLDELVYINILEGDEAVYVETVDSSKPLRLIVKVGARSPLYAGSAPKLLLSSKTDAEINEYLDRVKLERFTENTLLNDYDIKVEIDKIRRNGYSISYSEHFQDTVGLSYPIYDDESNIIAAIGVSFPIIDHTKEYEEYVRLNLEDTARKIWSELGYRGYV